MKKTITVLFASIILSCVCYGKYVYASVFMPLEGNLMHILSVYQSGDEVIVVPYVEEVGDQEGREGFVVSGVVEIGDYPQLALRQVDKFNPEEGVSWELLYSSGRLVRAYDKELGDGWLETEAVGLAYIRDYPWVYSVDDGWLYCVEDGLVAGYPSLPTPFGFWFWSVSDSAWFYRIN